MAAKLVTILKFGKHLKKEYFKNILNCSDYRMYDPLTKYLHVGVSSLNVVSPSRLYLEWEYDAAFYKPWKWEFVERPELFIHRIVVDSAENQERWHISPRNNSAPSVPNISSWKWQM